MSWMNLVRQVAQDRANRIVNGRPLRITGARQHAYIEYNKGIVALENAVAKLIPEYVEKLTAEKEGV